MKECIFCKIVNKEIPAEILYEDGEVIAFPDIQPKTPVHILVIPKRHIESISQLADDDKALAGKLILVGKELAQTSTFVEDNTEKTLAETGYKLLFRVGEYGGQEVLHIHLHVLGGGKMYEKIGVQG